jgi:hypothetical protein
MKIMLGVMLVSGLLLGAGRAYAGACPFGEAQIELSVVKGKVTAKLSLEPNTGAGTECIGADYGPTRVAFVLTGGSATGQAKKRIAKRRIAPNADLEGLRYQFGLKKLCKKFKFVRAVVVETDGENTDHENGSTELELPCGGKAAATPAP